CMIWVLCSSVKNNSDPSNVRHLPPGLPVDPYRMPTDGRTDAGQEGVGRSVDDNQPTRHDSIRRIEWTDGGPRKTGAVRRQTDAYSIAISIRSPRLQKTGSSTD